MAHRLQVLLLVSVLLVSCAGRIGPEAVLLPVPTVRQQAADDCGVAAATALLRYHGLDASEAQLQTWRARAAEAVGLPATDLVRFLQEQGCEVWLYSGDLASERTGLIGHLLGRRPVLVMIDGRDRPAHYVLVLGHDPVHDSVVIMDPAQGRESLHASEFQERWAICDHLSILAVPTG
ncbi:MAG: cysteine peptidase family C39 domain-containing protein [Planctomycetota bacterium]